MDGRVFGCLFSTEVTKTRDGNIHCTCPHAAFLSSNRPTFELSISDLLLVRGCESVGHILAAYLSFEEFMSFSECSHLGLKVATQRGRARGTLQFLHHCSKKRLRWPLQDEECGAGCADADAFMRLRMKINSVVQDVSMTGREVFWEKLRFQIITHLTQVYGHR